MAASAVNGKHDCSVHTKRFNGVFVTFVIVLSNFNFKMDVFLTI